MAIQEDLRKSQMPGFVTLKRKPCAALQIPNDCLLASHDPSHHCHTENCHHCSRMAPSQPHAPPFPPVYVFFFSTWIFNFSVLSQLSLIHWLSCSLLLYELFLYIYINLYIYFFNFFYKITSFTLLTLLYSIYSTGIYMKCCGSPALLALANGLFMRR